MSVEASFYTLTRSLTNSTLLKLAPKAKLDLTPQTDLHEHLIGFLGFVSAVGTSLPPERWTALMEFIISVAEVVNFEFEDEPGAAVSPELPLRDEMAKITEGIWLVADGIFDSAGRKILGSDGEFDSTSVTPSVPEPRKSYAGFLYGAFEMERDNVDQGQAPSSANLSARPLDECYRMIEFACKKAARYGFTTRDEQFLFASVMLEIGPNFDDHPVIRSLLMDASLAPAERLDACVDHPDGEKIWEEVDKMIDKSLWSASTAH